MFGDRLRFIRHKHNLTMEKIATKLGLSISGYSKYERNEREPNLEILVKISKLFNVSTDFLLGVDELDESEIVVDESEFVENWLLEINNADENKKETMKIIWKQIKKI